MMTPTHLLVGAAAFAKPGNIAASVAALAGALMADLSIYVLFVWSKLAGIPELDVWRKVYWQEPWQMLSAISNSVPIWLALFGLGWWLRGRSGLVGVLWIFAAASLLHLALDLPFHHDDAHKHFWPIADWRYHSPLSYWDDAHHAGIVRVAEILLALGCVALLWRRFETLWVRTALTVPLMLYGLVPLYFALSLGGA